MTVTLNDLPDISFVEKDINKILNDMIIGYEDAYFQSTGKVKKLYPGDPIRIFLYSQALRELQLRVLIEDAAKQNLLKYSRDKYLDNLGAILKVDRLNSTKAKTKIKFILSKNTSKIETIPSGARVSPGGDMFFAIDEDVIVQVGENEVLANATCTVAGTTGNGFSPGQINILVDPLPWISRIENTEISHGGTDIEDDLSYRNRIHLASEGFSVAGSYGAYEYFIREYSSLISDVKVYSSSPGVVDVVCMLKGGEVPGISFIEGLQTYLSAKERRPLTDNVIVSAPNLVSYNIDLTYYIATEDITRENLIKSKVEEALEDYIIWQKSKIGRDINPSELISKIRLAGAKRVDIRLPVFMNIGETDIAMIGDKIVVYGGLENE